MGSKRTPSKSIGKDSFANLVALNNFGLNKEKTSGLVPPILRDVGKLAAGVASVNTSATGSATGSYRNKCALQPGHSLMDWIRLGNSGVDLTGVQGQAGSLSVTVSELRRHNAPDDVWIALRGRVYNVTHYLAFHPGGEVQLMRGAGIDATTLFQQIHPWVNYEQILQKCHIGKLVPDVMLDETDVNREMQQCSVAESTCSNTERSEQRTVSAVTETHVRRLNAPRFDWIQQLDHITLIFYTEPLANSIIDIRTNDEEHSLDVRLNCFHYFYINLEANLRYPQPILRFGHTFETGKVEICLRKATAGIWRSYGDVKPSISVPHVDYMDRRIVCYVANKIQISHNTYLLELKLLDDLRLFLFPIAYHLRVFDSKYQNVCRYYTPIPSDFVDFVSNNSKLPESTNTHTSWNRICLLVKKYDGGVVSSFLCDSSIEQRIEVALTHNIHHVCNDLASVNTSNVSVHSVVGAEDGANESLKSGTDHSDRTVCVELCGFETSFCLRNIENIDNFVMLAAGTGITPMLSIIEFLLQRRIKRCRAIRLLCFHRTENDILLSNHLEYIEKCNSRFCVRYILSQPNNDSWSGLKGHISRQMLAEQLAEHRALLDSTNNNETFWYICGPAPFTDLGAQLLNELQIDDKHIYKFPG